ncbi:hypothetical protein QLL95_gp0728 [Cotonvirus japonicus]|uniref:Uncharacterized protein n=1 Tax=Cotonvirus japonicus TaxID=2811091 RepID=A0ABM7NT92_9VIRU|nr:hypothetical protein QLL95_gp0728 [Cotonvirus japonicus]BCS83395.1 hypothetical protein [Cotonvirus japonicus]
MSFFDYPNVGPDEFNPLYAANPYYGGDAYNMLNPYQRCGGYGGFGIYDIPPWRGQNTYCGYGKYYRPWASPSLLVAPAVYRAYAGRNFVRGGRQMNSLRAPGRYIK